MGIIGLLVFVLDILAIMDLIKSRKPVNEVLLWILLILLLPFLGMILYFVLGKKKA